MPRSHACMTFCACHFGSDVLRHSVYSVPAGRQGTRSAWGVQVGAEKLDCSGGTSSGEEVQAKGPRRKVTPTAPCCLAPRLTRAVDLSEGQNRVSIQIGSPQLRWQRQASLGRRGRRRLRPAPARAAAGAAVDVSVGELLRRAEQLVCASTKLNCGCSGPAARWQRGRPADRAGIGARLPLALAATAHQSAQIGGARRATSRRWCGNLAWPRSPPTQRCNQQNQGWIHGVVSGTVSGSR